MWKSWQEVKFGDKKKNQSIVIWAVRKGNLYEGSTKKIKADGFVFSLDKALIFLDVIGYYGVFFAEFEQNKYVNECSSLCEYFNATDIHTVL